MSAETLIGDPSKNKGIAVADLLESQRLEKKITHILPGNKRLRVRFSDQELLVEEGKNYFFQASIINGIIIFSATNKYWWMRSQNIYPSRLMSFCLENWDNRVRAVRGSWNIGSSVNATTYLRARKKGKTPEEAAKGTWTARMLKKLDFSHLVQVVEYPTWISALFERESDKPFEFWKERKVD